jgi:hypothetical protein
MRLLLLLLFMTYSESTVLRRVLWILLLVDTEVRSTPHSGVLGVLVLVSLLTVTVEGFVVWASH